MAQSRTRGQVIAAMVLSLATLTSATILTSSVLYAPQAQAQEPPELAPYYQQQLQWGPCPGQGSTTGPDSRIQCARLTVPRDYANPQAGDISLLVNRYPPRSGTGTEALVINPGGPGAPGTALTWYVARVLAPAVNQQQAIVGFDPRGTGDSQPVDCLTGRQLTTWLLTDPTPDTPAEERRLMRLAAQIGAGCQRSSAAMAPFLGTEQTVRDMDVLRAALNQERLNYLGFSYGTYLGTRYAEEFPDRVGRMVLDGAIDPRLDAMGWTKGQSDGFQLALTRFAEDCARQAQCPFNGDARSVVKGINRLLVDLDARPMRTSGKEPLVQAQALNAIFTSLYSTRSWPTLRSALGRAVRGDGTALQNVANQAADRIGPNNYSSNQQEAFLAIACWDAPAAPGRAELAKAARTWARQAIAPELARSMAWGVAPCTGWYGHQPVEPGPARTTTTSPILILGTRFDPATPYAWATALREQLPTSRLITWEGDGHTAFGSGSRCVDDLVQKFLITGTQLDQDLTCPSP